MHRPRILLPSFLVLAAVGIGPVGAGAAPDVTVTGEHRSGDYGTGVSQDNEAVTLSLVHGKRFQFHARLPALRLRSPGDVAVLPVGPVPLSPEQRQARGQAGGPKGVSGSSNGGSGQGGPIKSDAISAQPRSSSPLVADDAWVSGMGDLRLGLAARLLGRPAGLYRLDADLTVKAPTADEEKGLGTGEWDVRLGLMGERRFWTCTAFASLGWNRFGDPSWIDFEDAAELFAGVESEPLGPGLLLAGWVDANTEIVPGAGGRVVVGGTIRSSKRSAWKLSLFGGLTDAAEDVGLTLGYTFAGQSPRPRAVEVAR